MNGQNSIVNTILILVVIALIVYGFFWYRNRQDAKQPGIEINIPAGQTNNTTQ